MSILTHIPPVLKNKYLLTGGAFVALMCFFDPKDVPSSLQRRAKLKDLQKSELHLTKMIAETRKELDLLKTNAGTVEKYAREKYLMKKDNEDLFLVNTVNPEQ